MTKRATDTPRKRSARWHPSALSLPLWFGLLMGLNPGAAAAQATATPPDAPAACTQLGAPLLPGNQSRLHGGYIRSLDGTYVERIGTFTDGMTRSVRSAMDGTRSAQPIKLLGRELCSRGSDGTTENCTVPIICASGEVDLVLFDETQTMVAAISLAESDFAQAQEAAAANDWVLYSGGSGIVTLSGRLDGLVALAPAAAVGDCTRFMVPPPVRGQNPEVSMFWWNGACQSGAPNGPGDLLIVEESGNTRLIVARSTFGLGFVDGQLAFADTEIDLAATCNGPTSEVIPTSADAVTSVDLVARFPPYGDMSEPFVQDELARKALEFAETICGPAARSGKVRLVVQPYTIRGEDGLQIEYDAGQRVSLQVGAEIGRVRQTREATLVATALPAFAEQARSRIFRVFEETTRDRIGRNGPLNVLADGIAIAPHEFLVATAGGLQTRMPWKAAPLSFRDGHFVVSWRSASYLPVRDYFAQRNRGIWTRIAQDIGQGPRLASLDIVCLVPAEAAGDLPATDWVTVDATIQSFDSAQLTLTCEP